MSDTLTAPAPEIHLSTPRLTSSKEHLVRASGHLWRVHDRSGRALGHLRVNEDPLGVRYRAERLHLASGSFRLLGDFWSADDAVAALRNG